MEYENVIEQRGCHILSAKERLGYLRDNYNYFEFMTSEELNTYWSDEIEINEKQNNKK